MKEKVKSFVKEAYYLIPFKKAFFDTIKRFYMPPRSLYRFLVHRDIFELDIHGQVLKLKHPGFHFYIENEFYWKGYEKSGFEAISRELWMKLSTDAKVIFDVGANTGLYSLFSALKNKEAQIYAFEPIIRNVEKLRFNADLNDMKNIEIVDAAVSSENGSTIIFQPATDVSTTSTLDADVARSRKLDVNPVEVKTLRLDSFVTEQQIEKVDLIKIDVEGFEVPVFESLGTLLKSMKPSILAEIRIEDHGNRIMELLKGCDYLYFDIDEKSVPTQVEEITKSSNNNFLICTREVAQKLQLLAS